jgi:hypothetical protein
MLLTIFQTFDIGVRLFRQEMNSFQEAFFASCTTCRAFARSRRKADKFIAVGYFRKIFRAFFLFRIAIAQSSFHHGTGVRPILPFLKGTPHSAAAIIESDNALKLYIPLNESSKLNLKLLLKSAQSAPRIFHC